MMRRDYIRDGEEIYRESFATIRREADLSAFSEEQARIVVRMIHACGMVDLAGEVSMSSDFVQASRAALAARRPIFCDCEMVAHGIIRRRLTAGNEVICTLRDPRTEAFAHRIANTRSAAAIELWGDELKGALVAVGNAPTALFHLLDLIDAGAPCPAAIVGVPVGFIGASESKDALARHGGVPFLTVRGRRGGSAMAAAAVNALAEPVER
jgi:precorrin-8X/cobalt-precorrin-8 methylmutase